MPSESQAGSQGLPRWVVVALALLLLLALGAVGFRLWQRHDPFFDRHPAVQQASALRDAARARPLTDEEFDEALALLDSDNTFAQLSAITTVQLETGRAPERRGRVVEALERCGQRAEPAVRQAAKTAAARLQVEPKGP